MSWNAERHRKAAPAVHQEQFAESEQALTSRCSCFCLGAMARCVLEQSHATSSASKLHLCASAPGKIEALHLRPLCPDGPALERPPGAHEGGEGRAARRSEEASSLGSLE